MYVRQSGHGYVPPLHLEFLLFILWGIGYVSMTQWCNPNLQLISSYLVRYQSLASPIRYIVAMEIDLHFFRVRLDNPKVLMLHIEEEVL